MTAPALIAARSRTLAGWAPLLPLLAILLLTVVVYSPSLDDWFIYHDYVHLGAAAAHSAGDFAKRVLDPADGGESLFGTGKLYRPVYYLTLLAEERAFGLGDSFPYHLVNLSLHLLNITLVWAIARKLTHSLLAGYVAAAVYGLHPVYYDAPAWISAITELLLATFSLSALYMLIRSLEERGALSGLFYLGSLVSAALALGSREPGASLFLVLPAYYFLVHAPRDWLHPRAWLRFVPFFAVLGAYGLLRLSVLQGVGSGHPADGTGSLGWHIFPNIFSFNRMALLPIFTDRGPWMPTLALLAPIVLMRAHEHFFSRGGGAGRFVVVWWYLVVFVYATADWLAVLPAWRYLYVPSAAFAILCGMFIVWLGNGLPLLWLKAVPWARPSLVSLVRAAVPAGVFLAVVPLLAWGTLYHQRDTTALARDSKALLTQLRETYPSLPEGSTLYVVNAPGAFLIDGNDWFLSPAVYWYYRDVAVRLVGQDELGRVQGSMSDRDRILFFANQTSD
ncbi:MAG TPA: hypothetical protein VJM69_04000 [Dehalococcoidia bacterium]|nr:hypothetical protein [Dehalococcoidia bacterium]